MLRLSGIPARLTVGFAPGQFNPFTGYYIVHNTDAYALTEVYFPEYGWFTVDPIPGHELIPPSFAQSQTFWGFAAGVALGSRLATFSRSWLVELSWARTEQTVAMVFR